MTRFRYETTTSGSSLSVVITGYDDGGDDLARLFVPEEIEGLPVRSIGKFAFAGRAALQEVHLPRNLVTLSLFAFQNCIHLRSMELYNTTQDYYDGVIRACTSLQDVTVHCVLPDNFIIVREMLRDTDAALRFHLLMEEDNLTGSTNALSVNPALVPQHGTNFVDPNFVDRRGENPFGLSPRVPSEEGQPTRKNEIDLTFPEYVSEAQEDTMARAIHFSIEGAGMAYRECVSRHKIDFYSYDNLFNRLTEYDFSAAADICLGRLMFPVSLRESARAAYRTYLCKHAAQVVQKELAEKNTAAIRYLTKEGLIPQESMAACIEKAVQAGNTEICSLLMDYQNQHFGDAKAHRLTLDW